MNGFWKDSLNKHLDMVSLMIQDTTFLESLSKVGDAIIKSLENKGTIFFCGNGGSAADAQHLAAELVGRFGFERPALAADALTVNTSTLTALGNDYSYEIIFARQVEARGRPEDMLFGLTTSGNSANVVEAAKSAHKKGMKVIALTGQNRQSRIADLADYLIPVPSIETPRIQEAHILVGHMLCDYVERKMFDRL